MTTHITESQTTRHNARESDLKKKKKKVTTASDSVSRVKHGNMVCTGQAQTGNMVPETRTEHL